MFSLKKLTPLFATVITVIALTVNTTSVFAANYHGAIAISPSSKAMGWSYDYKSRWQAENAALRECYKHASDCRIATWFRNACGAVAVGEYGGWGANWGRNIRQAKWNSKRMCRKHDSHCQVKRWVCTTR